MKKLILASNNIKKVKEIKEILSDLPYEVLSLKDANISIDVIEDGDTFKDNAKKKAMEIREYLIKSKEDNFLVLADDSGLEVESLNGAPGIYSARYCGEHGNDEENNKKLLDEMKDMNGEDRKANFTCAIALVDYNGEVKIIEDKVYGYIKEELSGAKGFGYDPLFYYPEFKKTFAELDSKVKNEISHRGKALKSFRSFLEKEGE